MAYSDSFPAIRPSFQFNADAGRLDSRISYTRSTTGSFYGKDKHLSSDNLLTYSENFGAWSQVGLFSRTGGQTDPAGGSTGFTLRENSSSGYHRNYLNAQANESFAFVVYAKQNSGTRYLCLTLLDTGNDWESAIFDLAGGAPTTVSGSSSGFTNVSATQTASGNGYYKCVLKANGYANTANVSLHNSTTSTGINTSVGLPSYTGDGSSSIDVAFASLSTTGATDYNATSGQIHREYAPTLQTAAINAPRFEFSATDSASMGLLIEGSSTNLLAESTDFSGSWQIINATKSLEAIAPNGALNAIAFREGTNSLEKRLLRYYTGGGGSVTISIYAKLLGNARRLVIRESNASAQYSTFDLATGTKVSGLGSIESVGNGWFRCQLNLSTPGTNQSAGFYIVPADGNYGDREYAGDGYSGLLLAHPQAENQSWASSWISTTTSAATRAADSASVDLSAINQDPIGTDIALATEFRCNVVDTNFRRIAEMRRSSGSGLHKSHQVYNGTAYSYATDTSGTNQVLKSIVSLGDSSHKLVSTQSGASAFAAGDGVAGNTKTSTAEDMVYDRLYIGSDGAGVRQLDGHISRIALYGNSISETNATALSS